MIIFPAPIKIKMICNYKAYAVMKQ